MPALTSFRDLIEAVKRDGVLRSISRAVDPRYELIAVMRAVQRARQRAAFVHQRHG